MATSRAQHPSAALRTATVLACGPCASQHFCVSGWLYACGARSHAPSWVSVRACLVASWLAPFHSQCRHRHGGYHTLRGRLQQLPLSAAHGNYPASLAGGHHFLRTLLRVAATPHRAALTPPVSAGALPLGTP